FKLIQQGQVEWLTDALLLLNVNCTSCFGCSRLYFGFRWCRMTTSILMVFKTVRNYEFLVPTGSYTHSYWQYKVPTGI
ncbi:hypothetical protein Tco_1277075, partial [Tanacetum coccineum]